jgi:hypothetical protein
MSKNRKNRKSLSYPTRLSIKEQTRNIINNQAKYLLDEAKKETCVKTVDIFTTAMCWVLYDKEDFDRDRLVKVMDAVLEEFDSINKGYISMDDLNNTLVEELGLDIVNAYNNKFFEENSENQINGSPENQSESA